MRIFLRLGLFCTLLLCAGLTEAQVVPRAPSAVTATPSVLSWVDNASDETYQDIYRKAEACAGVQPLTLLVQVSANTITYTDTAVLPGTTYCYQVRAGNAFGVSDWSNTVERVVPASLVGFPSGMFVQTTTPLNVRIAAGRSAAPAGPAQKYRARGTVTGTCLNVLGEIWCPIDYETGTDGWSWIGAPSTPTLIPAPIADFQFIVPSGKTYQINNGPILLVP